MKITIGKDKLDMAQKAADAAAEKIRKAIAEKGEARIIVATGASQFEFLQALVKEEGIDWTKVTGFHLVPRKERRYNTCKPHQPRLLELGRRGERRDHLRPRVKA